METRFWDELNGQGELLLQKEPVHVNTSTLASGNSPGARKEKQIKTEFEVTQVRDRDDTLKGGRLSSINIQITESCIVDSFAF